MQLTNNIKIIGISSAILYLITNKIYISDSLVKFTYVPISISLFFVIYHTELPYFDSRVAVRDTPKKPGFGFDGRTPPPPPKKKRKIEPNSIIGLFCFA